MEKEIQQIVEGKKQNSEDNLGRIQRPRTGTHDRVKEEIEEKVSFKERSKVAAKHFRKLRKEDLKELMDFERLALRAQIDVSDDRIVFMDSCLV